MQEVAGENQRWIPGTGKWVDGEHQAWNPETRKGVDAPVEAGAHRALGMEQGGWQGGRSTERGRPGRNAGTHGRRVYCLLSSPEAPRTRQP